VIELTSVGRRIGLLGQRHAVGGVWRGLEHVAHTFGESSAGIGDAARHRQRAEIVERIGDLFVHRALAVLELALDREGLIRRLADHEDVDAPVLADDGLADLNLPVDLQSTRTEAPRDVAGDQVRVFASGHVSEPSMASRLA